MPIPEVVLPSSAGDVFLGSLAGERLLLYIYPRTRQPDTPTPPGWDALPGARGCTQQACGFRDYATA